MMAPFLEIDTVGDFMCKTEERYGNNKKNVNIFKEYRREALCPYSILGLFEMSPQPNQPCTLTVHQDYMPSS
jgi:hypothetical protein